MEPKFNPGDPCVCLNGVFTYEKGNNRFVVPAKARVEFRRDMLEMAFVNYEGSVYATKLTNLMPKVAQVEDSDLNIGDFFMIEGNKRKLVKSKDGLYKFTDDKMHSIIISYGDMWLTEIRIYTASSKQETLFLI